MHDVCNQGSGRANPEREFFADWKDRELVIERLADNPRDEARCRARRNTRADDNSGKAKDAAVDEVSARIVVD